MKGQLSAEMLIIIVVVMAIVGIASVQLIGSAKETSGNLGEQTERLNKMTSESVKSEEGQFCIDADDCKKGLSCMDYRCN